jgi:hypothetical protein
LNDQGQRGRVNVTKFLVGEPVEKLRPNDAALEDKISLPTAAWQLVDIAILPTFLVVLDLKLELEARALTETSDRPITQLENEMETRIGIDSISSLSHLYLPRLRSPLGHFRRVKC